MGKEKRQHDNELSIEAISFIRLIKKKNVDIKKLEHKKKKKKRERKKVYLVDYNHNWQAILDCMTYSPLCIHLCTGES